MARYDYDSQIDFIQKQFDDAQKRGEKRGKRMAREALKTQAIGGFLNLGIRGINNVLNRKADELHMQQVPQLARYQQYINDYSKTMNMLDPYLSRGGAIQDNVRDYLYDSYVAEAGEKFTEYEPGSYTDFLFKKAQENSLTLTPIIQTLRQEGADVGSLENFTNNYARYANHATPRTIGGAIVKTVKDFFNRNNEETIKYNDEKAKNALYNTPLFNEITELGNAVRAYGAQGNGVVDVMTALNEKAKKGEIVFKDIRKPEVIEWDEPSHGSIIKKKGLLYMTRDANGNRVVTVEDLNLNQYENKKLPVFNETDKKSAYNAAQSVVASFDKKDERVKIFNQVIKNEQLGLTFGSQILEVTTNLGRNPKDVTAQQIATNFLLNQAVKKGSLVGLRTTMTNWDVAQLSPPEPERETEYLKNELLPNIKTFKEDIQSKLGANHPEVFELYTTTLKFIQADSMDLTLDERNEYIADLNKEFGYETSRNLISQDIDDEPLETIPMPLKKEPMSITEVSSKYKVDEDFINKLISIKPKVGSVAQQAPFREDPIDLVTDKMLYDAGYISKGKDAPAFKMFGRRQFIRDLYKDLEL